jgi:uncharacterized membrane protein
METLKIECYFNENNLRGYSHKKFKTLRIRNRVLRALKQLKKKAWFYPATNLLLVLSLIVIILIIIDLFINVT